jgi:hypothetical protein
MKDQTVTIGQRALIDVIMDTDATMLNEAVAVGYGTMIRKELSASVASVKSEELNERATAINVGQALAGKMAGVRSISQSGRPGGTMEIRPGTTGKYKLRDYAATAIGWSSPTVNSAKNNASQSQMKRNSLALDCQAVLTVFLGSDTNSSTAKTERFGGYRLNPYFSAWLMGFPKKWTEAGMAAFQKLTASRSRSKKKVARCS